MTKIIIKMYDNKSNSFQVYKDFVLDSVGFHFSKGALTIAYTFDNPEAVSILLHDNNGVDFVSATIEFSKGAVISIMKFDKISFMTMENGHVKNYDLIKQGDTL